MTMSYLFRLERDASRSLAKKFQGCTLNLLRIPLQKDLKSRSLSPVVQMRIFQWFMHWKSKMYDRRRPKSQNARAITLTLIFILFPRSDILQRSREKPIAGYASRNILCMPSSIGNIRPGVIQRVREKRQI